MRADATLATLLRAWRERAQLTQEQLARRSDLNVRTIRRLEAAGPRLPRTATVRLLADALELNDDERDQLAAAARGAPHDRAPREFPLGVARCTLPADHAVFAGRGKELDQITTAVTEAAQMGRVIAIHAIDGMPGIGKTALAVHVAHRLKDRFADRQLFVDLHAHTPGQRPADPLDVLADLLAADGADTRRLPASVDGRAAIWRGRMADKRLLLVLDNAASTVQVEPLLPNSATSLVLVTSRRSLGDLPSAVPVPLDLLAPEEASAIVNRLAPHTSGQPEAVADLVAACGYLPLAVSITARLLARRRSWKVTDLLSEIHEADGRLLHLTVEQRTVATVFDLSYDSLDPERQRFFRLLGLHPGVDIDGYAAAALTDVPLAQARQHLDGLHDDRLLTEPVYRRYRMHDLIRAYTRTLTNTMDPDEVRQAAVGRLLDFYQHTATRADAHLATYTRLPTITVAAPAATPSVTSWDEAATWLRTERANLLACIHHATTAGHSARTVGLTTAVAGLFRVDGPYLQAASLHETAAAAARRIGDRRGHATALYDLAETRHLTGDYPAAADLLSRAVDHFRALDDRGGEAMTLCEQGSVRWVTGDYPGAAELVGDALDLFRALGDRRGEATALGRLGNVRWATGDYPAAADHLNRALDLFRDIDDRRGEANVLYVLGSVRWVTGDYPGAADQLGRAVDLYRALGYRLGEATALNQLGAVRRLTGDYPAAVRVLTQALDVFREIGDRRGEAIALTELGVVRRMTGAYGAAADLLDQALNLYQAFGHQHGQAIVRARLAVVAYLTGDHARAADLLHQALTVFTEVGAKDDQAEALNHLGTLHRLAGQPDRAHTMHRQALTIARHIHHRLEEAHALEGIGRAALDLDQTDDGIAHLRQAHTLYQQLGVPEAVQIATDPQLI